MSLPESLAFLNGGGEMSALARTMDWSDTVVGPPETWPQSLKTAVSICLGSKHPIVIWWGKPAYTQFYNDAYVSFLSEEKHPAYFGRSGRECWSEIWPVMGPMIETVFRTGQATWSEDFLYIINRALPREEAYFTFSYSPIFDDHGKIGGIFCACNETTARVIGERRMRTLRDLGRMEAEAKTVEASCHVAARTLSENRHDIPFALIYLLESDAKKAALVASFGVEIGSAAAPAQIELDHAQSAPVAWPLHIVSKTGLDHLIRELSGRGLSGGPWPEAAQAVFIVPISAPGQATATGFLVSGLSPRLVADDSYRGFLKLAAGHIGVSVANARAYEEERRNAAWSAAQKEAFQAAINGEPLQQSLGVLVRAVAQQLRGEGRCGFYITDANGTGLRHVAGMPESYVGFAEGFNIGPDSFACGLAVSTGKPVIVPDVAADPRWKDWRGLAEQYAYRAVWSFPVGTSAGKIVGAFAMYHQEHCEPAARDYELAAALTQAAAIIISRHDEAEERARTVLLLEERAAQLKLVSDELNHRVKNTLATVQAIAQLTMRNARHPNEFAERFFGRIQSMARAHSLLTDSTWQGADLSDLIRDQLSDGPVDGARLSIDGPSVHLHPQTALHVAMMLHELASNSIKYGALSGPLGFVSITWTVSGDTLGLQWAERGGPLVSAPRRRGFGTTLIEQAANSEGGKAERLVNSDGMTWKITLTLRDSESQEIGRKAKGGKMETPSPNFH